MEVLNSEDYLSASILVSVKGYVKKGTGYLDRTMNQGFGFRARCVLEDNSCTESILLKATQNTIHKRINTINDGII